MNCLNEIYIKRSYIFIKSQQNILDFDFPIDYCKFSLILFQRQIKYLHCCDLDCVFLSFTIRYYKGYCL